MVYRLLRPLPLTLERRTVRYTLQGAADSGGAVKVTLHANDDPNGRLLRRFRSLAHAEHTFREGIQLEAPSVFVTFFRRAEKEGYAELVYGPHMILSGDPDPYFPSPPLDGYLTFHDDEPALP